ncbi:uncharacterized protein [Dysidea avara]|uniref:uncharacterized protein isoform X1 n=1 Tax=Dysidea avara TaxID=196820 RepID=UPI00331A298B
MISVYNSAVVVMEAYSYSQSCFKVMKLGPFTSFKPLLLVFVLLTFSVNGCQVERKAIDDHRTLLCSDSPPSTSFTWLFNNRTQVDASVVISHEGRTVMIPSGSTTVYGDYSCFENDLLKNCFSVYIAGTCNQTCSMLTVHNSTIITNSTITFTLRITVNTSPDDHGTIALYKDGSPLMRSNVSHTSLSLSPVTYYIHNAQPMDSGIYYAEYFGTHASLLSNYISIEVIRPNDPTSSSTDALPPTSMILPTPTETRQADSKDTNVGIIVGPIVGALVLIAVLVFVLIIVVCRRKTRRPVQCNDEDVPTADASAVDQNEAPRFRHCISEHLKMNDIHGNCIRLSLSSISAVVSTALWYAL